MNYGDAYFHLLSKQTAFASKPSSFPTKPIFSVGEELSDISV